MMGGPLHQSDAKVIEEIAEFLRQRTREVAANELSLIETLCMLGDWDAERALRDKVTQEWADHIDFDRNWLWGRVRPLHPPAG